MNKNKKIYNNITNEYINILRKNKKYKKHIFSFF